MAALSRVSTDLRLPLVLLGMVVISAAAWVSLELLKLDSETPRLSVRIVENLKMIDAAKKMWASDNRATGSVDVTEHDLAPYLRPPFMDSKSRISAIASEVYAVNPLGKSPEALLTRKLGRPFPAGTSIRLTRDRGFEIIPPNPTVQPIGTSRSSESTNRTSAAAGSGG